jgi:hypothetical protein
MKNPVLSVRKGAEVYDDSPAESERRAQAAEAAAQLNPPPGRRRPHARRIRMTYLPLVFVAIGLVVVFQGIPRLPTHRASLAGWQAVLRATPYGNVLLLSVTFIHDTASAPRVPDSPPEIAVVRFVLQETGERLSLEEALVKSPMTIRGQLPYSAVVKKVQAEVSIGADKKTLTLTARAAP